MKTFILMCTMLSFVGCNTVSKYIDIQVTEQLNSIQLQVDSLNVKIRVLSDSLRQTYITITDGENAIQELRSELLGQNIKIDALGLELDSLIVEYASLDTLIWDKNPELDIGYYTVYRNDSLFIITQDTLICISDKYMITATDTAGNESGPSNMLRVK